MYELIQAGENTFYMDCPAKVGFYKVSDHDVVLIDSGSDKDAGKKVKKHLDNRHWQLRAIFNTHAHADHIGGNQYLQSQTGCKIYLPEIECAFAEYPILEPTTLYGGYTFQEMRNKFLMAKESFVEKLTTEVLPSGIEWIRLPGHSYQMAGFRTSDDVVFLADSLVSKDTLNKYQISYLYDVKAYLDTLEMVKDMRAKCFIPAHADAAEDIAALAQANIDKVMEIIVQIKEMLTAPKSFEEILAEVFSLYGLTMTLQQHLLVGSTLKSYLAYLKDAGDVSICFANNQMLWQAV